MVLIALILKDILKPNKKSAGSRKVNRRQSKNFPVWIISLLGGLLIIGILGYVMTTASLHDKALGSNAVEKKENGKTTYVLEKTVENKGIIPLVVCLSSEDKTVEFSKNYFLVSKGKKETFEITASSKETIIKTRSFLQLLPVDAISYFFKISPGAVCYIVLAIWIVPITLALTIYLYILGRREKRVSRAELMKRRRISYE
jgi:beta-lactamase regulating signal transducer with metallopeptidase domain